MIYWGAVQINNRLDSLRTRFLVGRGGIVGLGSGLGSRPALVESSYNTQCSNPIAMSQTMWKRSVFQEDIKFWLYSTYVSSFSLYIVLLQARSGHFVRHCLYPLLNPRDRVANCELQLTTASQQNERVSYRMSHPGKSSVFTIPSMVSSEFLLLWHHHKLEKS